MFDPVRFLRMIMFFAMPYFGIYSAQAKEISASTPCIPGNWINAGQSAVFENDIYGTLKNYLIRAQETLTLSTPSLSGFAVLADSETAKIPGTLKSQGLAFDDEFPIFSWRYGLQRTDASYRPLITCPIAIPPDIQFEHYNVAKKNGFSHIGDIDIAGGKLYAPIEDEDNRTKPFIAIFDPKTLIYTGEKHMLPTEHLPNGVPWIAVDEPRRVFYTMNWNSQDLLVFDLNTYAFVRSIRLIDITNPNYLIRRVQGGKVHDGFLYISSDSDDDVAGSRGEKLKRKRIYEIDPVQGLAKEIIHLDEPERAAMQGLAFGPDGVLHVLVLSPYFYNDQFPSKFEINGDDWSPSAILVRFKTFLCK